MSEPSSQTTSKGSTELLVLLILGVAIIVNISLASRFAPSFARTEYPRPVVAAVTILAHLPMAVIFSLYVLRLHRRHRAARYPDSGSAPAGYRRRLLLWTLLAILFVLGGVALSVAASIWWPNSPWVGGAISSVLCVLAILAAKGSEVAP